MNTQKLVLVVDDSSTSREFINSVVQKSGYKTILASNGEEALLLLRNNKPDFMFLDLLMAKMDGIEVLEKMKDEKIKTPVVVVTADVQEEVKDECMQLGALYFLNKPFKEKDIQEIINRFLD